MVSPYPGATLDENVSSNDLNFKNDYRLKDRLRSGSYGIVYTTTHNRTHEEYAVKVIDRTKLKPKDDAGVFREVGVLKDFVNVDNIVRLIDFYVEPNTFYVVQVYAKGGDVFDRLAQRTYYTEKEARDLAGVLLDTMKALHEKKLVHRDLKPENLLLKDKSDDISILVADFGFAAYCPPDGLKTRCGTPAFVAPEILVGKPYNTQVDMWSTGCLLYMLIGGYPPFQDKAHRGLFRKIRAADFSFHDKYWKDVSIHSKQLISKLLTVDPLFRLTASEALQTAWLHAHAKQLSSSDLSLSLGEMKKFNARRKLKSAISAVVFTVHTNHFSNAFRHDKVSDLFQAADKWDEQKDTVDEPQEAQPTEQFSMNKVNKNLFKDVYEMGEKIHRGSFAVVNECLHKEWNQKYAVKIIKRDDAKFDETVLNEVAIMNHLHHPNIVKVVDFFEESDYYYIVMELMDGGDVFDRITEMTQYTEKDARDLAKILLETVDYMHRHGVTHRDLKPQNLLLKSADDNATIKVADFGFARRVHTPKSITQRVGTPSYVAPEILKNIPYDQSCDMWSVGVILFVLLCGYTPFLEENQDKMFERIRCGDWKFEPADWDSVSDDAKDLISRMLVTNPEKRISASDALKSSWINQDDHKLSSRDLSRTMDSMRGMKGQRFQNLAKAFMAMNVFAASHLNQTPQSSIVETNSLEEEQSHEII